MKFITTSWDDGHELDFKLAAYLSKYHINGTFYIPKANAERPVMTERKIQELSKDFEIGGHGLQHVRLYSKDEAFLWKEVHGSYQWLSDVLGQSPSCFCFPGGVHHKAAVAAVFRAGYQLARTTALFSTACAKEHQIMDTTLQVYPHKRSAYFKHLVKRRRWTSLTAWLQNGSKTSLAQLADHYLSDIAETGGCFHLWGHSWEIEQQGLWRQLEEVLKVVSNRPGFTYVSNALLLNS